MKVPDDAICQVQAECLPWSKSNECCDDSRYRFGSKPLQPKVSGISFLLFLRVDSRIFLSTPAVHFSITIPPQASTGTPAILRTLSDMATQTFHPFPNLPLELQTIIWSHAIHAKDPHNARRSRVYTVCDIGINLRGWPYTPLTFPHGLGLEVRLWSGSTARNIKAVCRLTRYLVLSDWKGQVERSPDWEWARHWKKWAVWILESNVEEAKRRLESSQGDQARKAKTLGVSE